MRSRCQLNTKYTTFVVVNIFKYTRSWVLIDLKLLEIPIIKGNNTHISKMSIHLIKWIKKQKQKHYTIKTFQQNAIGKSEKKCRNRGRINKSVSSAFLAFLPSCYLQRRMSLLLVMVEIALYELNLYVLSLVQLLEINSC